MEMFRPRVAWLSACTTGELLYVCVADPCIADLGQWHL